MAASRDSKVKSTVEQRVERADAARSFVATWSGRGYEKGDTASFWIQLLSQVVGLEDVVTAVHFEERVSTGGFIDAHIPSAKTLIEQKALGVNLDKPEMRQGRLVTPFEQAKAYADEMKNSNRPDYIIVSNFSHFRIHDLDQERPTENYVEFSLEELPEQFHLLDFIVTGQKARRAKEQQVSMHAGELVGKLYRSLSAQYIDPASERSRHSLNVLCVRLVFCLFAEDAGLFGKDSLYRYLSGVPTEYVRGKMIELFRVLDTPYDDRDVYISDELSQFPYVNGGLFREEDIEIPQFTEDIVALLANEISRDTDWSKISPTIFGGVFESTLNPETRAKGGMHYTSPENIHKVIDPLFFDSLKQELESILTDPEMTPLKKTRRLKKYHNKLSSLTFFDPACGSGNFLTETYLSLRRLENRVIGMLAKDSQISLGFENVTPIKVSLGQFYGLEINDFAVSVATTALWIAKLQANIETQELVDQATDDFPLRGSANIHRGNALTKEWSEIINAGDCDYIIGKRWIETLIQNRSVRDWALAA